MAQYRIKLSSKNEKSLKHFLRFWKTPHANIANSQQILDVSKRKNKRKKLAVIKSPHVNKKAQEHFQQKIRSKTIRCFSWEIRKSFMLLKKMRNHMFPGIKILIERKFTRKKNNLIKSVLWDPSNIPLKAIFFSFDQRKKKTLLIYIRCKENRKQVKKTSVYLQNLDVSGIKKIIFSLGSSVG